MKIDFSVISERLTDAFGERDALVNIERGRRYNFREFHKLTNRIVNMMHSKLGIDRSDHYLCILENDSLSLTSFFTAFKGKGCACYTNYRDTIDEHAWQIAYVNPKVVFIENELLPTYYDMLRERKVTIVCMDRSADGPDEKEGVLYFWDLLEDVGDENPGIEHDDRKDTLILRFTGGTTGKGKCAAYSIDNWLMCRDSFYALPEALWHPDIRFLHIAPLSHGSSMVLLPTIFRGACTVTMNVPNLAAFCRNIETERITAAFLVPTLLYRLLEMPEAQGADLSSLDTVYYGAAPMSPSKLKLLQNEFGNIFVQLYGATEHAAVSLSLPKYAHLTETPEDNVHLASAGLPVPGVEILIVNDDGEPVPRGEIGELWLRSRAICLGYYGNEEGTKKEFQDGYWKSADMGYMDDKGYTYIVDRKKDMIISGGFNIYATEVEAAINSHPDVIMSAVIGIPHEDWGEAVHAEVMLREGCSLEPGDLIADVKDRLGKYKVPKTVKFVDELPVSAVGKVLRRKVRKKYWKGSGRQVG